MIRTAFFKAGTALISLKANTLSFGGRKYDIVTAYVEQKGEGEGKKSTRKGEFTLTSSVTVQP